MLVLKTGNEISTKDYNNPKNVLVNAEKQLLKLGEDLEGKLKVAGIKEYFQNTYKALVESDEIKKIVK